MLTVLPAAASAATQSEIDTAIAKALAFAPTQQDPATGEPPAYEHSGFYSGEWLASGYAAAGLSAADVRVGAGPSLQDFLFGEASGFWDSPISPAPENTVRLILTAHAAGIDTSRITASQNLPADLVGSWKPSSGGFSEPNTFSTAWGALALRTTPLPIWALQPALSYLRTDQHDDGGWSFYPVDANEASNPDITAAAIGALCAAGVPAYDPAVHDGLAFLHGLQVNETGAIFNSEFGENIDTSTWTVNALNSCGIDPQSSGWTTADGKTPIDHILSMQLEDGGFAWATGEPWFPPSTGHALRALAGDGFAVEPPARENPALPAVRPAPTVTAGTPVPHVLAIELAPGNVRLCNVTAPADAPLPAVLAAARTDALPAGCVTSFSVAGDVVTEIDGVVPEGADESWLVRLDRGAATVAAAQSVRFGDVVSLRLGPTPAAVKAGGEAAVPAGPAGAAGQPGGFTVWFSRCRGPRRSRRGRRAGTRPGGAGCRGCSGRRRRGGGSARRGSLRCRRHRAGRHRAGSRAGGSPRPPGSSRASTLSFVVAVSIAAPTVARSPPVWFSARQSEIGVVAAQLDFPRRVLQGTKVGRGPFEAGDRRRVVRPAAAGRRRAREARGAAIGDRARRTGR